MRRLFLASSALLALASCSAPQIVPQSAPPAPVPVPTRAPVPQSVPARPLAADWRDWPLTPGNWVYRQEERGSVALYGRTGMDADLTLRCDRARGRLFLSRRSDAGGDLTIRTSTDRKTLTAQATGGNPAYVAVELAPRDPLIDSIGFSRGRFVVQGSGADLVLPSWPEILRVAEDCRG
ncbi:MAG: hypothetical protein EOP59_02020 [Sphingomonadales bacterium]|nr:MAG: hypothetical protein EOP59_02020 [Sphingomonadales bacterium]